MITGLRLSAALGVAAELGRSHVLLADGPRTTAELAVATSSHTEDTLHRLLRALATVGVYDEHQEGAAGPSPSWGEGLPPRCPGQPASPRPDLCQARRSGRPTAHPGHSVRTGENAFEAVHGYDVWTHRRGQPEQNASSTTTWPRSPRAWPRRWPSPTTSAGGEGCRCRRRPGLPPEAVLDGVPAPDRHGLRSPHVVAQSRCTPRSRPGGVGPRELLRGGPARRTPPGEVDHPRLPDDCCVDICVPAPVGPPTPAA